MSSSPASGAAERSHAKPPRIESARKRALLGAAVKRFRERGYHATTINDIGSAAGLTGPALYAHFGSKDEVLEAAVWEMARDIRKATSDVLANESAGPRECLASLVRALVRVALCQSDFAAVYLSEARHLPPLVYGEMLRSEERYRDDWLGVLRRARPTLSDTRARILLRTAVQVCLRASLEDPELDQGQLAELFTQMALGVLFEASTAEGATL